jgi:hypothetical protein
MKKKALLAVLSIAAAASGCISTKSYVDPTFAHARYEDLKHPTVALALKVDVEFRRNGVHFPRGDAETRGTAERTLRGTGLITPTPSGSDGDIKVMVNNVGDVGAAVGKGVGTGLTLGLVGSTVRDGYEMTVTLTTNGKAVEKTGYTHQLISTVGNASGPPGLTPTTPSAAYGTIVEQMLLNAIQDFQSDGLLAGAAIRPVYLADANWAHE